MGMVKHKLEEKYELYSLATDILERVGAIQICEAHGERCLLDESLLVEAYKLGNTWVSRGVVGCDKSELTDAIEEVLEMTPEECPRCSYVMYDD